MRKIITIVVGLVFLLNNVSNAQDKKFTMEEAITAYWQGLYPEQVYGRWIPQSKYFAYHNGNQIKIYDPSKNIDIDSISLDMLNKTFSENGIDSIKRMPMPQWITNELYYTTISDGVAILKYPGNELEKRYSFEEGDEKKDFDALEKGIISVSNGNDIFLVMDGKRKQITKSQHKDIIYGQDVSRREFGIDKGTFWSPDKNYLAYYINDCRKVKNYPLVDITTREAEVDYIKYPMAGMSSEHISLGIYNVQEEKTILIEADDTVSEKYLTNITWGPEEKYLYIQVLNRGQNHMKLNQYDVSTGKLVKTLFEEKHEKYVEPQHPLTFIPGKKDSFLYQTRRDGYNHIYLYNTDGELIRQITSGDWEVTDILGFDKKGKTLYYVSTEVSPIERHAYAVSIDKPSKKTQLTNNSGYHRVSFSGTAGMLFDQYSSQSVPGVSQFVSSRGKVLHKMVESANPIKDYALGEMEIGKIKAADGTTDLFYRLIKPVDFDPNKKYPAIIYVYGGPHAQLVTDSWGGGGNLWNQYMAQRGYVMLTIDNRGSANRGLDFENVIHRNCGKNEMLDQLEGVKFLKNLGYVDDNRIGIHGWSYGGFMTTSLTINYPEIFKVAVAGGPVIDWKYYEIMYGERYMDTPEENPEGYQAASLVDKAKDLKSKLLLIHGGIDPVVVQQHSLVFIRECIKNNIPVDYFVYPRAEHNVRGYDRIHLMQKVTDYFEDYLK